MSDDVLSRIDATLEAMERNRERFDPFGGWPTHGIGEAMRWQPEKPAEKPAERPAAASPYLTRQDVTGQPDRIAEAYRAEVVRQGLDVDDITDVFVPLRVALRPDAEQVEALRPACKPDPPARRPWWQWRPW
ncbi:hypothetical protein ACQP1P_38725 [Dactylosporangium sp. CA-052675]|uniref:hypothetical protein n=1 Tax=Dactylosporangium sp. CA-052675 TaxID=3239927 RepID=UPI003D942EF0